MSEEQIKKEFEVWYRNRYCLRLSDKTASIALQTNSKGEYDSYHLREAWEIWQAAIASQAKSGPEVDEAAMELRVVYEAARKFLRYNGVDKDKVNQAVDELDEAIEAVKHIDGGYKDFPLEAVPPLPTDDDRVRELESKYNELIMAVACKFPDETRHDTALRYIRNAEAPAIASMPDKGGE